MHRDLVATFGGASGIRDEALLDSAMAQPEATAGARLLHRTIFDQAAAYMFHLCGNHAFMDGNKRIAFAAMDTFLRMNGWRLTLTDDEAVELTMAVASGAMKKRAIAAALRSACAPAGE